MAGSRRSRRVGVDDFDADLEKLTRRVREARRSNRITAVIAGGIATPFLLFGLVLGGEIGAIVLGFVGAALGGAFYKSNEIRIEEIQ